MPRPASSSRTELGELGRTAVARPFAGHDDDLADRRPWLVGLGADDDHPIGELERLVDVVGHEEHRRRRRRVNVEEQVLHSQPGQRVKRAERLVEQQDRRTPREGTGEGRPAGHPAGDLAWSVPGEPGQPDEREEVGDTLGCVRIGHSARQAERNVRGERPPRQESRFLERDRAARVDAGDRLGADPHLAGRGLSSPAVIRSSVDLPQPLVPSIATTSPASTVSVRSRRTTCSAASADWAAGRDEPAGPKTRQIDANSSGLDDPVGVDGSDIGGILLGV